MIFVVWNVFEEMPHLPVHVNAVSKVLPESQMIFLDGAYPEFPSEHRLSKDGTSGFCKDAGRYFPVPVSQPQKRSVGLRAVDRLAKRGDYIVMLDGDEELTSFQVPAGNGLLHFTRTSDGASYLRARVYRWRRGYEFRGRHFTLYHRDVMVGSLTEAKDAEVCGEGIHHDTLHSLARQEAKGQYYRVEQEMEASYAR